MDPSFVAPALSVVVPTYRQPDLLRALLDSLAAQEVPAGGAEVLVVDDGSPEFGAAATPLTAGPLPVRWVRHPRNLGRARARNSGIRHARGEIVVFLDGDMAVAPGFLRAHAEFHAQHPGEVAVGAIRFAATIRSTALSRYVESRGAQAHAPGAAVPFKCFVTGNSSLSRPQLEQVGLFDEAFSQYGGEDLELGYRLHRAGATFRYLAGALSFHGHLRPLHETLELMETYGRCGLPHLVTRHPELGGLLRLEFLRRRGLRARLLRLALASAPYGATRTLARALAWAPLPALLYSYLWWSSRTRGYLAATAPPGAVP